MRTAFLAVWISILPSVAAATDCELLFEEVSQAVETRLNIHSRIQDDGAEYTVSGTLSLDGVASSPIDPDPIIVTVKGDEDPIGTAIGVPLWTKKKIQENYGDWSTPLLENWKFENGNETWTLTDGLDCDAFELDLLMFLVYEWILYG